jgi:hypothetical protein
MLLGEEIMRGVTIMTALTFGVLGFAPTASAEEVRIGHLETNDDTGINWVYFNCQKSTSAQMQCDILQTLIMKKQTDAEIDTELKELNGTDPLIQFKVPDRGSVNPTPLGGLGQRHFAA